jgi:hypothetical protein
VAVQLGVGQGSNSPPTVTKRALEPWTRTDSLVQPKHWKMDMMFGTWNVRRLHRTGALKTVARDLGKYELDFVGVQGVRW